MRIMYIILLCVFTTATGSNLTSLKGKVKSNQLVPEGDMTYMVSVRHFKIHVCAGCFITSTHILTVARCIYNAKKESTFVDKVIRFTYSIYTGSLHRRIGGKVIKIRDVDIHPKFNISQLDSPGDIAVILVDDIFETQALKNIKPISPAAFNATNGMVAALAGWGLGLHNPLSKRSDTDYKLKKISVVVRYNQNCPMQNSRPSFINENYICGQQEHENELAQPGDGGGPLIYQDEIIGLYSFPVRKVSELNVYIKISKYVPYIEKAKKRLTLKNKRINTGKFSFVKQKANNMREKYRKNNERRNSQTA